MKGNNGDDGETGESPVFGELHYMHSDLFNLVQFLSVVSRDIY